MAFCSASSLFSYSSSSEDPRLRLTEKPGLFQFLELLYYGTNVHDREYQALYNGGPVLDAFVRLTGMPLDKMHYLPKELRKYTKKQYK